MLFSRVKIACFHAIQAYHWYITGVNIIKVIFFVKTTAALSVQFVLWRSKSSVAQRNT